jgi:hypothetical protein
LENNDMELQLKISMSNDLSFRNVEVCSLVQKYIQLLSSKSD